LAPASLASEVMARLKDWTGRRWVVSVSSAPGEPTLRQQERADRDRALEDAAAHPLVQAILATFPGAKVKDIHHMPDTMPSEAAAGDVAAGLDGPPPAADPDAVTADEFGLDDGAPEDSGDE
jgi:DNA polymerase-3 subunit gamma/tau